MKAGRTARGLAASGERADQLPTISDDEGDIQHRHPIKLTLIGCLIVFCIIVLTALGIWQLERRTWKLDLINQVDQRVHAPVKQAPGPDLWAEINAKDFAYLHVTASGRFLDKPATLVQAVTARGSGFWVLSPFQSNSGFTVLINRGFIPTEKAADGWRPNNLSFTSVSGLLRITEPAGGFLRNNDPTSNRWYSRDVAAIATTQSLDVSAPYFIDAEANAAHTQLPIGGLTVVAFSNNHLVYALTWFGMALLLGLAFILIGRNELKARRRFKA
ncbi:SURF1 family protein [Phyllobacterium sp. YR531]|uniref:SURF1 family protein n=1 Tax=Phyllobacterium sp. YR531 TaxID=1144343 RepID=UPI00026F7E01|nr:SURF1 family protein [Phyllobacterium sp. YR531]EJN06338.1 hypothetical protein PMI41_00403 [Phyllobacterium sp. YR531]